MGLFSSIKKAVSSVTDFLSPVSDLIGIGSSAYDLFSGISGGSLKDQQSLIDYQTNAAKNLWQFQKSNSHQLEVKDLRAAGLNPILSAGTASSASAFAPSGQLSETGAQRTQARVAALQNHENLKLARTQQALNESGSARNAAEAEAALINAKSNALRARADAGLANQRTINERLYPSNQPEAFKYLNSARALIGSYRNVPSKPIPASELKQIYERAYGGRLSGGN